MKLCEFSKLCRNGVPPLIRKKAVKGTVSVPGVFSIEEELLRVFLEDKVNTKPEFVGGASALMSFLGKNVRYPPEAIEKGIKGRVEFEFIVEPNGYISNISIIKREHPLLDNEALRVISMMPMWIPGKVGNRNVRVSVKMPINFRTGN